MRQKHIADALAASRAESLSLSQSQSSSLSQPRVHTHAHAQTASPTPSSLLLGADARGDVLAAGSAIPSVDIEGVLDKLVTAQVRQLADVTPKDHAPPDEAYLRSLLDASDLSPACVARRLEKKLDALCAHEYPEPMAQSNRKHGLGHSATFIREHMTREFNNLVTSMLTTLRSGKIQAMPKSAVWRTTGNLAARGDLAYDFEAADGMHSLSSADSEDDASSSLSLSSSSSSSSFSASLKHDAGTAAMLAAASVWDTGCDIDAHDTEEQAFDMHLSG